MQHQKKIDEEWKAKVQKEREELRQKSASTKNEKTAKIERVYDQIFTKLIQDLTMQMNMAIQSGDVESAKHLILLLEAINYKTKGRQPLETADVFKHLDMIKAQVGSAAENFIDEEPEENQNSDPNSSIIS